MTFYSEAMPTPLRAALLAAWGSAYLQGSTSLDTAVRAIEDDDEPHLVVRDVFASPDELADALAGLRDEGVVAMRLALPAPGDLLGLTGPPEVNRDVLAAGEAAVAIPAPGSQVGSVATTVPAFVPDVRAFGTPGDQGHCVTWRVSQATAALPDVPSLAQADRELAQTMGEAAELLATVTVVSSGDARDVARRLRGSSRSVLLPSVAGPRAESLVHRATTIVDMLEAARSDDGAALTAHSAAIRAAALAPLDRAARRALVAAVAACHDTGVLR